MPASNPFRGIASDTHRGRARELLHGYNLTEWETEFCESVASRTRLSDAQREKLDELCERYGVE